MYTVKISSTLMNGNQVINEVSITFKAKMLTTVNEIIERYGCKKIEERIFSVRKTFRIIPFAKTIGDTLHECVIVTLTRDELYGKEKNIVVSVESPSCSFNF